MHTKEISTSMQPYVPLPLSWQGGAENGGWGKGVVGIEEKRRK